MRITNPMMASKMMLNINRNTSRVDSLYTQWASGKKIQFPSENPIIASRALKFRTTVAENAQYQRNVEQGMSWMEVTEDGYSEVTSILKKIRELSVQGDGAETMEDKQAMATQIASLKEQLGLVMNNSYTGRYLFSGYRTDEPGVLLQNSPSLEYKDITQNLTGKSIEEIKAYQKFDDGSEPVITEASVLKLPYKDCTNIRVSVDGAPAVNATIKPATDVNAYNPGPNDIYYIQETGELVLGENMVDGKDYKIQYDKKSFEKGELNPKVYFTCTEITSNGPKPYNMDNQDIEYEFGVGTRFAVNGLAKDVFTAEMYADIMSFCDTVLNASVSSKTDVIAKLKDDPANAGKSDAEISEMATAQIDREKEKIESTLQQKFSNMIEIVDKHAADVSKGQTDLGARASRLELIQNRLEADETSYTKLMSENEDADLVQVAMLLKNAESVYQASLQVGMNMIQVSLANFL